MRHSLNRRGFLACAACAGASSELLSRGVGSLSVGATLRAWDEAGGPALKPATIHKVYAGRTGDSYLTRPTEELGRIDAYLADLETRVGNVRFVGGELIPQTRVEEVLPKLEAADAVLIVHLSGHGGDAPALGRLVDAGLPTAVFTQPFSGHGWMEFPRWRKEGKKVVLLPTSDWKALDQVAGLMRVPAWLKQTRILAVGAPNGTAAACEADKVKAALGAELVTITNQRVMDYFKAVDPEAAEAEAETYWISQARKIVEPTRQEIIDSARLFLAIKQLMAEERAQAITSRHCMGDPRGCLTFSKLNDMGLVGACEGDIDSTLTMLIFAYAFGVPGFITDPVIDTAKNAVVHFHCTSATMMDGPAGDRLPFTIRTQTDSKGGVGLEVENRVGQAVTCAKLVNLNTLLYCAGPIIETSTSPLACRTQFSQQVRDARKLFLDWGGGVLEGDTMTRLHRVVFYGDHAQALEDLGTLVGFKPVEEGGPSTIS